MLCKKGIVLPELTILFFRFHKISQKIAEKFAYIGESIYLCKRNQKKHNIMKEFETLTKDVLQRERQYGRLLCEWKCKGNEENGEYGGWCLIINYKQNKWKILPISGDDLSKGGITAEGEFWFAYYDYLVQARIFTLVKKGSEEYKYITSQIKNGKENLLRED